MPTKRTSRKPALKTRIKRRVRATIAQKTRAREGRMRRLRRPALKTRVARLKSRVRRGARQATTRAIRQWEHHTGTGVVATTHRRKDGSYTLTQRSGAASHTVRTHTRQGRVVRSHTRHT